jgi:helicase
MPQDSNYHGLFVGIDRYESSLIGELRCAERDARALHALFADTFGDGGVLLRGAAATRAAIEQQFAELATTAPDDIVVLAFSGHGSESHELVTYDTDLARLSATALPLDIVLERFKAIPARRLICILDCCFSGGLGAKVLQAEHLPRSMKSTEALLAELSGEGRLIFTASAPDEEAWESNKTGHGFLTHYLLEALQGAKEVRKAGKVSVLRLLEYVTERVSADAANLGKSQRPTVRGTIEGELSWPIFEPGENYAREFPERAAGPVTASVTSLAARGFRAEVVGAWAESLSELNALQLEAVNDYGLLAGDDLLVSAPTSSGKTMIGELAALNGVEQGTRAIFLLPMKALVNDKHQEFERKYAAAGIRTIRATGDYSDQIPELLRGQYEICLMTYEKCAGLVLAHPHLLEQVGTVVIDEVQMLTDRNRGAGLEFILTLIRVRRRYGADPQLVALSAVIGDTHGFERWLGGRLLRREERPVPLDEGVLGPGGQFRFRDPALAEHAEQYVIPEFRGRSPRQNLVVPLVRRLVEEGKQVIVFREQRGETVGTANYLAADLGLPPAEEALAALPAGDPSVSSEQLRAALQRGVAFHNSDLSREERAAIEAELRKPDSALRVITATTTLAMGINSGAEAVVIAGLDHPARPPAPYTVAEYKNMVGRAGRLGYSTRGTSFTIATSAAEEQRYWAQYVLGHPEDLTSQFIDAGSDPRKQILQVIAASPGLGSGRVGMTADEVVAFLEDSFGAFQQRERTEGWAWSRPALEGFVAELDRHALIESGDEGRYLLTDLGLLAGSSGYEVESVLRLVDVIRSTAPEQLNDATLIALTQLTLELDAQWLPIHSKSPKEPQTWFGELQRHRVPSAVQHALQRFNVDRRGATMRAKRAGSCFLWIAGTGRQEMETILTRHVPASAAAGQVVQVASRTADLLPLACGVAEILHAELDLTDRLDRLRLRLQIGLPEDLVELAELVQDQFGRADYLSLKAAGLTDVAAVSAAEDGQLTAALRTTAKVATLREALTLES